MAKARMETVEKEIMETVEEDVVFLELSEYEAALLLDVFCHIRRPLGAEASESINSINEALYDAGVRMDEVLETCPFEAMDDTIRLAG